MKRNEFDEMYAGVLVHRTARIEVEDFTAGEGTVVNAHVVICGTKVHMGRECWIDEYAVVGGGSCDDKVAFLEAGNWLHMGQFSQLNIARGISAGDEVGIGIGSRIFTHGAYLSEWEGFPVTFQGVTMGDRVWLPNALVNPGVNIGSDVVVAAGAVVLSDIASGCLAGGVPAKILKSGAYPNKRGKAEREILLHRLSGEILNLFELEISIAQDFKAISYEGTMYDFENRVIEGPSSRDTELVRNQLRRHGIRFKVSAINGMYQQWN